MRVFLDANVLFTAAYSPTGKSRFLISIAKDVKIELITSDYAVGEALRNLTKKKPASIIEFENFREVFVVVPSSLGPCSLNLRAKDIPIFTTALRQKCTHLLTGDIKDFGPFMNDPAKTEGLTIQTVSEFLSSLKA